MKVIVVGVCIALLVSTSLSAQESKRMIEVQLPMSAAKAAEFVQLTALRQEIGVVSNQGGVIQLEPHRVRKNNPATVTLRVNIVGTAEGTSIAVVSGRWYSPLTAAQQRIIVGKDYAMAKETGEPVEFATKGWRKELWAVVENFAKALQP
jgi:hypothetical protein